MISSTVLSIPPPYGLTSKQNESTNHKNTQTFKNLTSKQPRLVRGLCLSTVQCTDQMQCWVPVIRMVMPTRKKGPQIFLHWKSEHVKDMSIRNEERNNRRGKAAFQTNQCLAFTSNYRRMKYELQLIFLPGVTLLRVLRTLGIYLGSKLTSFVEWPEQCHLCSVTSTSLWLLILDTCPSQKLTGERFLDKDVEQCNYRCKGPAEADQGMLSHLSCAKEK